MLAAGDAAKHTAYVCVDFECEVCAAVSQGVCVDIECEVCAAVSQGVCVDIECEVCTAVSRGVSVLTVSVRCVLL